MIVRSRVTAGGVGGGWRESLSAQRLGVLLRGPGRTGSILCFDPGAPRPHRSLSPCPVLSEDPRRAPPASSAGLPGLPISSGLPAGKGRKSFQPLQNFPSREIGVSVTSNEGKREGAWPGSGEPEGQATVSWEDDLGEGGGFVSVESHWSCAQVQGAQGPGSELLYHPSSAP